uniref:Uncharacterized protein n=1 Tax=Nelumbo nucifera TaxID=4432 RepID=A0A822Y144_NELNU|nr:TPA_asm: hypothetical protein HUJ06_026463 [Nelumbo nucifera]
MMMMDKVHGVYFFEIEGFTIQGGGEVMQELPKQQLIMWLK